MKHNKEDTRIIKSKKAIKDSFISLLETVPYKKFTIMDICKNANINRSTFYNYYRNKEDLFCTLIGDTNSQFTYYFNESINNSIKDAMTSLTEFLIDDFYGHYLNYQRILKVQDRFELFNLINKALYLTIYEFLSINSYLKLSIPKDFIAHYYSGALSNLYYWLAENNKITKEEFKNYIFLFLNF